MNKHRNRTARVGETEFAAHLCGRLDKDSPSLSPELIRALRSARHAAVAQTDKAPIFRFWKPLASCASAAVLVLTVAYINTSTGPVSTPSVVDPETELLFSEEDLQLYEDLEFYSWLANSDL